MSSLFQRRLTLFYLVLIVAVMIAMGIILNMVIKRGSLTPAWTGSFHTRLWRWWQ